MTSYMYNPSQKVTELLSKYLEFDPSEMEMGMWSGDLSLKNVDLRQDAIHPLLNKKANRPHTDPLKKAPLHLKLLRGKIGGMRIQIPWKSLVWGQGAVQLEISDVVIVLSFESREETERKRKNRVHKTKKKRKEEGDVVDGVSKAFRNAKQRRLREAERRQLQGQHVAAYLENAHRKNSIAREASKFEEAERMKKRKAKKPGRVDRWLKHTGSDLFWRFFAGLQGSIKNARIVIIQDGVEVGFIVQSINIEAGQDGTKVVVNPMNEDDLSGAKTADEGDSAEPPEAMKYESAYDDGEHVDKSILGKGLGLFVRKEQKMPKGSHGPRFSSSVFADDYLLRPVGLELSFSFFYPYPPDRRKKKAIDSQSHETLATAPSSDASNAPSTGDTTTTSARRRRGKREKSSDAIAPMGSMDPDGTSSQSNNLRTPALPYQRDGMPSGESNSIRHSRRFGGARSAARNYTRKNLSSSRHTRQSAISMDGLSVANSRMSTQDHPLHPVPRFDCRLQLDSINIVFSTRYYELLNHFVSAVMRMRNGRPDLQIRSAKKDEAATFHQKILREQFLSPVAPAAGKVNLGSMDPASMLEPNVSSFLAPLTGTWRPPPVTDDTTSPLDDSKRTEKPEESQQGSPTRAELRRKWWKYGIGAILWELRKRKHLTTNFRNMYISFDWEKQRYKRKEYIDLYIAINLEKSNFDGVWPFDGTEGSKIDELTRIEDELPLEQILLYRSIARSLSVHGIKKMPDTLVGTHRHRGATSPDHQRPPGVSGKEETEKEMEFPVEGSEVTLLSLLQNKFDGSKYLRTRAGLAQRLTSQTVHRTVLVDENTEHPTGEDDVGSGETADQMKVTSGRRSRRQSTGTGSASMDLSTSLLGTPLQGSISRRGGGNQWDFQAGKFYSSVAKKDSDGRTLRTKMTVNSKRAGSTIAPGANDERMRFSISVHMKCIDVVVVQEDVLVDSTPVVEAPQQHEISSFGSLSDGDEETSSDDVSDLSVLTDDQNFFQEEGQRSVVTKEDEEEEGIKLLATDFLNFGRDTEKVLLRFTISSFGSSIRGKSGGLMQTSMSIRRIDCTGDRNRPVFSLGRGKSDAPMAEIDLESVARKSFDSHDLDISLRVDRSHDSRGRSIQAEKAVSCVFTKGNGMKHLDADLSMIVLTADLHPAMCLLQFYSASKIRLPDKLLEKRSRDVARKFMVYKTATPSSFVKDLSTSLRIHRLDLVVPFTEAMVDNSEASDLDVSISGDPQAHDVLEMNSRSDFEGRSSVRISVETVELYSGLNVEELDTSMSKRESHADSLQRANRPNFASLEMLDLAELTASHDSFAFANWVATSRGISCDIETQDLAVLSILEAPVDFEILLTANRMSLLETEAPKHQVVVEVSPVLLLLSERRLELLELAKTSLDFGVLDTSTHIRKRKKPDPPRIEILSLRILNSVDVSCRRAQVTLTRDTLHDSFSLTLQQKEVVMEECLSDFLSVVSCFDLRFPNEEALSSVMQVCIGRLVGLGLTDDEAWGCTNAARLNFIDDIALMRRAHSEAVLHISGGLSHGPDRSNGGLHDRIDENEGFVDPLEEISEDSDTVNDNEQSSVGSDTSHGISTDGSANSAEVIETTLNNAVEKTVSMFASLLHQAVDTSRSIDTIVSIDLPLGLQLSLVKLFYDQHVTFLVTSLVATTSAGIELLTLVPYSSDEQMPPEDTDEQTEVTGHGISFSRFDLDDGFGFGRGGLAMSVLASDENNHTDQRYRQRERHDDVEIGEIEFLFSSNEYESVIDELSKLGRREKKEQAEVARKESDRPKVVASVVATASSVSALFTTDQLVPFCRLSLERVGYMNQKSLQPMYPTDVPSWEVLADSFALHNLSPEGQFYPDTLVVLNPEEEKAAFPFQLRYFKSPDPWQFSNRLHIEFTGFRLILMRQFIYELLHFFVYDRYGVGRLKKKYSIDQRDASGTQKPPLLYTVNINQTSVVCPRSSTSSDMACFEVEEASIAVSYVPETFSMPTAESVFEASPKGNILNSDRFANVSGGTSQSVSTDEFYDCFEEVMGDNTCEDSTSPMSGFHKDLKRRLTIKLHQVQVFTTISDTKASKDLLSSSVFRLFHRINGRASAGKSVYAIDEKLDRQAPNSSDLPQEVESSDQRWEEISCDLLDVEVIADWVPYMRLLISSQETTTPFALDARLSQLCLLLSVWDSNMQEMPTLFPFFTSQVSQSATPPDIPNDFPAYGSEEFVAFLEDLSSIRSEICCLFRHLRFRCTFDPPGYFSDDPGCFQHFVDPSCHPNERPGLVIHFEHAAIHVVNDFLNVKRIGIGASFLQIVDERRSAPFQTVLATSRVARSRGWAALGWGLREDSKTLDTPLPLPVMFSIFMTPGWSTIVVAAQDANGILHDLSWIWLFLDYFKSYYTNVAFGNAGHLAQRWTHKMKNSLRRANGDDEQEFAPLPGVNIDFRLWLNRPLLVLPSDYNDALSPSIRIHSETGLWYRYKSVQDTSSQQVVSTDLNLSFAPSFEPPQTSRLGEPINMTSGVKALIEGLSFGLRYDCNDKYNHKDCSLLIPYSGETIPTLALAGTELEVPPVAMAPPAICIPFEPPRAEVGPKVCEITCIIEVLPVTSQTLLNFFKGPSEVNEDYFVEEEDRGEPTFSVTARIGDIRVYVIDPVLGVQLPVAVLTISSCALTATKFAQANADEVRDTGSTPADLQVTSSFLLWADYFKLGITRSWEPLVEPFQFTMLYETSRARGQGFSIDADSPFHMNLSTAFLQGLGDTLASLSALVKETFGDQAASEAALHSSIVATAPPNGRTASIIPDVTRATWGSELQVLHEIPKPLKEEDRVAFSLRNRTGQQIRVHQQGDMTTHRPVVKPTVVSYLNHAESMGLTFAATVSVVRNLTIAEVPYPGLAQSTNTENSVASLDHTIDLQVPGCKWIQGIRVDTFGRKFESLVPRTPEVLNKLLRDWRLKNAFTLLTEIGQESGGRLVTVRGLFELRNDTGHPLKVVFHPDPLFKPSACSQTTTKKDSTSHSIASQICDEGVDVIVVKSGDVFQFPMLLLEEALLHVGRHLGSFWLCPDTSDKSASFQEFTRACGSRGSERFSADFCSRPIQLAKLVYESAQMFQRGLGSDITSADAKTGIQVSCPTHVPGGNGQAPFCYAIEVNRSPLVNSVKGRNKAVDDNNISQLDPPKKKTAKPKPGKKMHEPVAYSLSVRAPLVIVNLLPEAGRFELMHAIRRTVLWYADLQPGEQRPVHSVGLDSPLLLLVNLGFCRTPVGEGALVHHGVESPRQKDQRRVVKSIGKVAMQGTMQISKTLTAISESPDKKQGRANQLSPLHNQNNNGQDSQRKDGLDHKDGVMGLDNGTEAIDAINGKVHSVESVTYGSQDVAEETTVVDSVGQRLTLRIENVRGGGGQRRVSLFCPFWIVNTTEHCLLYKQDNVKSFVSGTVMSPMHDGSRPVDGSNRNYSKNHRLQKAKRKFPTEKSGDELAGGTIERSPMNTKTIFSGTPGSLATSPGRCQLAPTELAPLVAKDMALEKLASLAFMFNFFDEGLSLGQQTLRVQLHDGTQTTMYGSDWSRGFSLESVGFSQIVALPCKEGRAMELSVDVMLAPGFLSSYTKIVRFVPRYLVFNRLEKPIRLWQDSSVFRQSGDERSLPVSAVSDTHKETRKWRYEVEDKDRHDKINQYETLLGRFATLSDETLLRDEETGMPKTIPQGTTASRSALYVGTVDPGQMLPFILPDTRGERQLRVDMGGVWNVSSSFSSDVPGEHTLRVDRATDPRLLNHLSTRSAPKYKIVLPPPDDTEFGEWDGELGVFFETDWGGDKRILVKGTKRGKYAFNHTDIHVGDELLRIDGISVFKMTFSETMKLIKDRLFAVRAFREQEKKASLEHKKRGGVLKRLSVGMMNRRQQAPVSQDAMEPVQLALTFRTMEERLRKLRFRGGGRDASVGLQNGESAQSMSTLGSLDVAGLTVETKSVHNTMFLVLREENKECPPFRIQNRSLNHIVFYRQRGCTTHTWNQLLPGQSVPYSWEEPMNSKKLSVRVAQKVQKTMTNDSDPSVSAHDSEENSSVAMEKNRQAARSKQASPYQHINNEERGAFGPSITVRLEEIGFRGFLPIPSKQGGRTTTKKQERKKYLSCEVDTDGATRLLVISDNTNAHNERTTMRRHLSTLAQQISLEEERSASLLALRYPAGQASTDNDKQIAETGQLAESTHQRRLEIAQLEAKAMMDEFPEDSVISSSHQVVIEVQEAMGLSVSDVVGSCNPYCEVTMKGRAKSKKHFFQRRKNKQSTYFIEQSHNPKWSHQVFVFDVPPEAVKVTRGHLLQLQVRNFRVLGQHPVLGQASVHFGSLRSQGELVGWYPLAGRSGRRDLETSSVSMSDWSRGSIKIRAQWVYTVPALIDYFLMISQQRLTSLRDSKQGMNEQLALAIESDRRKRDTSSELTNGRIQKLVKLQRKQQKKRVKQARKTVPRQMAKDDGRSNHNIRKTKGFKNSLKESRDRYLYALYFQTLESKRYRKSEQEDGLLGRESLAESVGALSMADILKSPGAIEASPLASSKRSLEMFFQQKSMSRLSSPLKNRAKAKSLDDFFSAQHDHGDSKDFASNRPHTNSFDSPRRASRRLLADDLLRRRVSHRRLSLEINELTGEEQSVGHDDALIRQGQAMYDGLYGQTDMGISDLLSVNTDADDEAKRNRLVRELIRLGFVFHMPGSRFHPDHLPKHFRATLFEHNRKRNWVFRPHWHVGSAMVVRYFRSWQAAGALHLDPEVTVVRTENNFHVSLKPVVQKPVRTAPVVSAKDAIRERLEVPEVSPMSTKNRIKTRVETLSLSRSRFERACKRLLGSVLNPGGWLTVRPVTALNLPNSSTGMYVKLRFGNEVMTTQTVDARVSPRWSQADRTFSSNRLKNKRISSSDPRRSSNGKNAFRENDLHVHVDPQQTSGVIRISIVAEKKNKTKSEIGVLNIPLGAAIAACLDSANECKEQDDEEHQNAVYMRWFPLMGPGSAVPAEGDMGLSSRPKEREQLRDNMFQQYFAPCLQLALMWWPDEGNTDDKEIADDEVSTSVTLPGGVRAIEPPKVQTYFNVDISRVSVALVDSNRATELLSLALQDVDVRYSVSKARTRIGLVLGWLQLDHQGKRSREPVILAPTPSEHAQPTLQLLALKDNLRTKSNIVSYDYIGVALQELDLTVEESWLFELWDFFTLVRRSTKAKAYYSRGQKKEHLLLSSENCFSFSEVEHAETPSLLSFLEGTAEGVVKKEKTKIYVEQLILGLIKINLSYMKGKKQSFELSDKGAQALKNAELQGIGLSSLGNHQIKQTAKVEHSEVFARWSQHVNDDDLSADSAGYNLPGLIAAVFPSVSDAPIRLQGKAIDHVFEEPGEILSSIKNFYTTETLKQVYKIIGSLDFVGNPTILFSSFVSGVRDLVVVPTNAFLKSPTNVNQVGIGVAKGALSFFSHSASGIFGFAAKMSATAGQAAAIMSMDPEYRQWHRDNVLIEASNLNRTWKRRGVQSVSEMLMRPVGDILLGVAHGASGVLVSPYKGYLKNGNFGLVRGVAVGTAGAVAKPLVGVLDALTHCTSSVHDIARSVNVLERRHQPALKLRLPYSFGPMKVLESFNPVMARSESLLSSFPAKTKKGQRQTAPPERELLVHAEVLNMETGVETYAIVTTVRVVLIKLSKDNSGALSASLGWEVDIRIKGAVNSQISDHGHNGVALTITRRDQTSHHELERKRKKSQKGTFDLEDRLSSANWKEHSGMSSAGSFNYYDDSITDDEILERPADIESGASPLTKDFVPAGNDDGRPEYRGNGEATEKLKWFTVLAEYQHRRQLTIIHNAIACVMGDFDAIITEPGHHLRSFTEGVTKFGIFTFDQPQTEIHATTSNIDLLIALENLPWMHEHFFTMLEGKSMAERENQMALIREQWTMDTDLKASEKIGGPSWLVEARARATNMQQETDPDDYQFDLMENFERPTEGPSNTTKTSSFLGAPSFDTIRMEESLLSSPSASRRPISPRQTPSTNHAFSNTEKSHDTALGPDESSGRLNDDRQSGHYQQYQHTVASDFLDAKSIENDSMCSEASVPPAGKSTPNYTRLEGSESETSTIASEQRQRDLSHDTSRVDRIELLMEQLVILNAQHVQQQAIPAGVSSKTTQPVTKDASADRLTEELAELRSQVEARARQDDVLRNEIAALRQQLADRRTSRKSRFVDRWRLGKKDNPPPKSKDKQSAQVEAEQNQHRRYPNQDDPDRTMRAESDADSRTEPSASPRRMFYTSDSDDEGLGTSKIL